MFTHQLFMLLHELYQPSVLITDLEPYFKSLIPIQLKKFKTSFKTTFGYLLFAWDLQYLNPVSQGFGCGFKCDLVSNFLRNLAAGLFRKATPPYRKILKCMANLCMSS